MCVHLKEWLLFPRNLLCYRSRNYDLLLYTSSTFAPLSPGFSNIYSLGASYPVKLTQYLQKLRTPTGKFAVHTLTGNSHL